MKKHLIFSIILIILICTSLFVGVAHVTPGKLLAGDLKAWSVFRGTRVPRTMALVLSGISTVTVGTIMQRLTCNRFIEPSTAGTVESASLGFLLAMLFVPSIPVYAKMLSSAFFALLGTMLFMTILRRIPLHSPLVAPLVGIMLGGTIRAVTSFFAYRYDMLQSMLVWTSGDFSSVMKGRYELLWIAALLTFVAYILADRFTAVGLGKSFSTNLGINYCQTVTFGLIVIAMVTALVVITVGQIPFLGLIIPNIVTFTVGDNMHRTLPLASISGAAFVLVCDITGRLIRFPYEIPISTTMSVIGSILFLYLLLHRKSQLD